MRSVSAILLLALIGTACAMTNEDLAYLAGVRYGMALEEMAIQNISMYNINVDAFNTWLNETDPQNATYWWLEKREEVELPFYLKNDPFN